MCLSETWLNHSIASSSIQIPGYQLVRADRQTKGRGGGVCAYVNNKFTINSSKYSDLNVSDNDLECLIIELKLPFTKPIIIIQCYKPPAGDSKVAIGKLQNIIDSINIPGEKFILGDFNINYAGKDTNLLNCLKSFENINNFKQLIQTPTRITRKTSTIIDHLYTNSRNIALSGTINSNISDHLPIFIIRKKPKITYKSTTFTCRKLKYFDFNFYKN